jgi:hypothetical protein
MDLCLSGVWHWMPAQRPAGSGISAWCREPVPHTWDVIPWVRSGSRSPAGRHQPVTGTPRDICWHRRRCRCVWPWPEPPAGATPHQRREPRALAKTGACGQLGSRTANRMVVPSSPSIRERACPARLRPARTATTTAARPGPPGRAQPARPCRNSACIAASTRRR